MKIKEAPISERPYEKLEIYGAERLSNAELIAIILKTGNKEENVLELSKKVLGLIKEENNLNALSKISLEEFMKIKGIGKVKAIELLAVCEITKRMQKPLNLKKFVIKSPNDVVRLLMDELKYETKEKAIVIMLNTKNIVQKIVEVSKGTTNLTIVEPRDIVYEAIKINAPKIILVHNHPSGDSKPSKQDFELTDRLYDSCNILGIQLLDHIVIRRQ